jgi:hypothetical protein
MFKWKPDWELGADCYDKAGGVTDPTTTATTTRTEEHQNTLTAFPPFILAPSSPPSLLRTCVSAGLAFRVSKDFKRSIEAFKAASHAHTQAKNGFHAGMPIAPFLPPPPPPSSHAHIPWHPGKSLENGADAARDGKMPKEATDLLEQAAGLYRREGNHEAAASALEKAGMPRGGKKREKIGNRRWHSAAHLLAFLLLSFFFPFFPFSPAYAAKICEQSSNWTLASHFYLLTVDVREGEDQKRSMKKALQKAIQMCIKAARFDDALSLLGSQEK